MKKINSQDNLEILRNIYKNPKASQRDLAAKLGFSIGKINYCIKALQNKGLIKSKIYKRKKTSLATYKSMCSMPQGVALRNSANN